MLLNQSMLTLDPTKTQQSCNFETTLPKFSITHSLQTTLTLSCCRLQDQSGKVVITFTFAEEEPK